MLGQILTVLIFVSVSAQATTTISFDELSERPLDGVSLNGVVFHSTGSNSFFPQALFGTTQLAYGETKLMSAPWAAGSASGELRVDFLFPVGAITFDAGLTTTQALADGFRVSLYSGTQLVDTIVVPTAPGGHGPFAFSEAAFSYLSPTVPLTSMTVAFNLPGLSYVFDNLTYEAACCVVGALNGIPTLSNIGLLFLAASVMIAYVVMLRGRYL
jgi:hypothetical protein